VFCPGNSLTDLLDLVEDGVCGGGPDEGAGFGLVAVAERLDPGDQIGNGGERAPSNGFLRDDVEPDFDLVEPGSVGRGEVDVVARPSGQPTLDLGVLMGGVVVDDEMDLEVRGSVPVRWPHPGRRRAWLSVPEGRDTGPQCR
jgi:hypothetical protein